MATDRVEHGQTRASAERNAEFFLDEYQNYRAKVESIDTYASISLALSAELEGMERLLDIGNGGVFDYDTTRIKSIVGLDLFLDNLPRDIQLPSNVQTVQGSALGIPEALHGFDGVVMVMLMHHLVGRTVADCLSNVEQALSEAHRVLRPGGKLVVMESCVPAWFFAFEKMVFRPASVVIEKTMKHPPTLQYPVDVMLRMIEQAGFGNASSDVVALGKYVLQYNIRVPSWATPVQPVLFTAMRP
jgi:SAM-dependent methyltransferase